mgnify:CR=1 FL=1|tara:strand:- start:2246 stop:2629 length:384 start_codon:yes stop_codon:yes gene_type:complete
MGKAGGYTRGDRPQKKRTTFRSQKRKFNASGGYLHTGKAFVRKHVPMYVHKAHRFANKQQPAMVQLVRAAAFVDNANLAALRAPANYMPRNPLAIAARRTAAINRRKYGKPKKLTRGKSKTKRAGRR